MSCSISLRLPGVSSVNCSTRSFGFIEVNDSSNLLIGNYRKSIHLLPGSSIHFLLASMASSKFRTSIIASIVLLLSISSSISATGNAAVGSFTITMQGYTVTGTLTDLTGHQSDVKLLMSIDQTVPTSMGTVHIAASGIWTGTTTDTMITGSIDQVTGKVHACVMLFCQDANFTGSGTWAGSVEALPSGLPEGSGTFQGTLNFQSPNPPTEVSVSGNWTCILNI
jgi:hypothetical protein